MTYQMFPRPGGVPVRSGMTLIAKLPGPIVKLAMRHGRLTAKVGEVWHIVPLPKDKP